MEAVIALVILGASGYGAYAWINSAKPPPANLRCANCPRLARQIRMHQAGHVLLAAIVVTLLVWGLAARG